MKKLHLAMLTIVLVSMAALFGLLWQAGSGAPSLALAEAADDAPVVSAVQPDAASNDLDTRVVITGTGFAAVPTVTLGSILLEQVGWVSSATLTATIPWGLDPGVYTLTVTNPDGLAAMQPNAFTVTQGIGVWTTNGPYGGGVGQLTLHPVTPTTIYALGSDIGLFVSDDGAERWELAHLFPAIGADLAFDAQNPDVIYLGSRPGQLHRTLDAGHTWEDITTMPELWWQHVPVAHPTLAGTVYVAACCAPGFPCSGGGVYRSDDYGGSWITLTVGLTDSQVSSLAIHPILTQTMLAGTASGNLYYSLDGGQTWTWTTQLTATVTILYFNPFEPLQAWATTGSGAGGIPSLHRSEDLINWTPITVDENLGSGGWYGWDMDFLTDTIWATTNGAYFSTDGGASWTPLSGEGPCGPGVWLAVNPDNPQEMYSAPDLQGVCKSVDGGLTWRPSNEGLAALKPLELAVSPADPDTVYVRAPGLHLAKSESGGRAWRTLDIGITPPGLAVDPFLPNRVYMNNQHSHDGGDTWHAVTFTLPFTWVGWGSEVTAITPHPSVSGRVLTGLAAYPPGGNSAVGLLYASDDHGEHWTYLGPTQPISWVTQIAYDAQNPDLIYAATAGSGLWKSADGGQSWDVAPHPGGITEIWNVFTPPENPNVVYAFAREPLQGPFRLLVSQDAGETWIALPDGAGGPFYFAPTQPPSLYTACFFNDLMYLCRSWDGGTTWDLIDEVQQEITSLAGGSDGERVVIYVGTKGGTVSSVPGARALDARRLAVMPGRGSLLGGGVYRFAIRQPSHQVYLPLVLRQSP